MSDDWQNEDDIKAELRILTDQLRTLRHELRNMVEPRKASPARAFLHRQSWPSPRPSGEQSKARPDSAPERPSRRRPKR